ncbi:MAG: malto-oligosyltrehalose trehalohydrolase [Steroidobacteraceae bacterium]
MSADSQRGELRIAHEMLFGAQLLERGGTRFRVWAPSVIRAELQLLEPVAAPAPRACSYPMHAAEPGWHELIVPEAGAGSRYKFLLHLEDGAAWSVPDPASRSNPQGVHDASSVVDPRAYAWRETKWRGRAWADAVVYELHVGTFTPEGTFVAAAARLPELATLGVTALQIMPLAAFPGTRNWGYDGVLPFAPAACYGTPEELKAFVDGAHGLGLMVLLDVVYNHFGPDGNYLHVYCPQFFNPAQRTPWGAAINFDGASCRTVRDFFVSNALYWTKEFCFDGLRLDAVHALRDSSRPDIVCEIADALRDGPGRDRQVHLVLENNRNEAHHLARDARGRPLYATAQWDDDVHHALHALLSGEGDGYYADYAPDPLARLGRALAEGFAYQGEHSVFRGKSRGEPSAHLPPDAFVGYLQNHDMIGNRAFGGRIDSFADARFLVAAYACLLLTPLVPMLFMGEEFAASTPFLYFCDFGPELGAAVAAGRRREFQRFAAFADEAATARIPDPNAAATFAGSKLRWAERSQSPHRERLALVREFLTLRRLKLAPHLSGLRHGGRYRIESAALHVAWDLPDGSVWRLLVHFGPEAVETAQGPVGDVIFSAGVHDVPRSPCVRLHPGAIRVAQGR